jgi:hypothetical protein
VRKAKYLNLNCGFTLTDAQGMASVDHEFQQPTPVALATNERDKPRSNLETLPEKEGRSEP